MEPHGVSLPLVGRAPALPQASAATWTEPSSAERLSAHPQLLAQHLSMDKDWEGGEKGKKKQNRDSCSTRHLLFQGVMMWTVYSWDELCCNRGTSGQLRKTLQHDLPGWSGTGEQWERARYCLVTSPAFHIYEQGSTCDWARERTDFPSCDPAQTQVCLERQEYSEHYIFARPVPACWWMHSVEAVFQERETGTGLEASLPAFLCNKPLRQESMSSISVQGHSLEQGHSKAESAQSCLRFLKFISEDTTWQRMHCSFGAMTGNLQIGTKLCDGLPTCQFYQQRDTGRSLVWDEVRGAYLQTGGWKTASVKVNSLDTSHYWPTSYSFISKSKKIWPIPTAHPPHDIYKSDQPRWYITKIHRQTVLSVSVWFLRLPADRLLYCLGHWPDLSGAVCASRMLTQQTARRLWQPLTVDEACAVAR